MSALSKPGIYCAGAIAPYDAQLIPAEYLQDVSKLDITASPVNNNTAKYYLVFAPLDPLNRGVNTIKIPFASSSARNTSYTNVKTTLGTSVS